MTHSFTAPDGKGGSVEAVHDWRWRDGKVISMKEIADTMMFAVLTGQVPEPTAA